MAGSILENLSNRKLAVIVSIVLTVLTLSFLLGGLIGERRLTFVEDYPI